MFPYYVDRRRKTTVKIRLLRFGVFVGRDLTEETGLFSMQCCVVSIGQERWLKRLCPRFLDDEHVGEVLFVVCLSRTNSLSEMKRDAPVNTQNALDFGCRAGEKKTTCMSNQKQRGRQSSALGKNALIHREKGCSHHSQFHTSSGGFALFITIISRISTLASQRFHLVCRKPEYRSSQTRLVQSLSHSHPVRSRRLSESNNISRCTLPTYAPDPCLGPEKN